MKTTSLKFKQIILLNKMLNIGHLELIISVKKIEDLHIGNKRLILMLFHI